MRLAIPLMAAALVTGGAAAPEEGGLPFDELPPQRLDRGQCALVLWTRTTPAKRVLMAVTGPAGARVQSGGKTVTLARTGWSGEGVYGHYPRQTYAGAGMELTVDVEFDTTSRLVGGALAPSGAIALKDAQGWSTVTPVAGMVACQS